MSKSAFFSTVFLGNIIKSVTVGRKRVLTLYVPDYYLSKKTGESVVDSYQINVFANDYKRMAELDPAFEDYIAKLDNHETLPNMELDIKISMSKIYKNNKGETVFPHPEFKLVGLRPHNLPEVLDSSAITSNENAEDMPF